MLEIVSGDIEAVKAEMKKAQAVKVKSLAELKKKPCTYSQLEKAIRQNDFMKMMYSPSKTIPVKVGGIVINYKLYELFLKRLKRFEVKETVLSDALVVEYWEFGKANKGKLTLDDISEYFKEFQHVPVAGIEQYK